MEWTPSSARLPLGWALASSLFVVATACDPAQEIPGHDATNDGVMDAVGDSDVVEETPGADTALEVFDEAFYPDCPSRGDFVFSLDWFPSILTTAFGTESLATITGLSSPSPDMLDIGIEVTSGYHEPGAYVITVGIPDDIEVDLHVGDVVTLSVRDLRSCLGCWLHGVSITRDGQLVLYAISCANELCTEAAFEAGPLSFEVVTGVCTPFYMHDGSTACFLAESAGIEVTCLDPVGDELSARLFAGQDGRLDCAEASYRVLVGHEIRVISVPEGTWCADFPGDTRTLLVVETL